MSRKLSDRHVVVEALRLADTSRNCALDVCETRARSSSLNRRPNELSARGFALGAFCIHQVLLPDVAKVRGYVRFDDFKHELVATVLMPVAIMALLRCVELPSLYRCRSKRPRGSQVLPT